MALFLDYELDIADDSRWLTVTADPQVRSGITYIQEVGDFICGPQYYTTRQELASFLIKYTVRGEGMLEYGGNQYCVRPGQIFWIDCRERQHYYTSPRTDFWHVIWVHFWGGVAEPYYRLFLQQNNMNNVVTLPPGNTFRETLESHLAIYEQRQHGLRTDILAAQSLTQLMTESVSAALNVSDTDSAPRFIRETCSYLAQNFQQSITLDDLAEKFSLDKYYLHKLFQRYTRTTPYEYLVYCRLNRSKELLRTTTMSIGDIAQEVGIESASYFIKLFKAHEGMTPGIYRKSWNKM